MNFTQSRINFFQHLQATSINIPPPRKGEVHDLQEILADVSMRNECSIETTELRECHRPDKLLTFAMTIEWHEDAGHADIRIPKFAIHLVDNHMLIDSLEFLPGDEAENHKYAASLIMVMFDSVFFEATPLRHFGRTVVCRTVVANQIVALNELPHFSNWLISVIAPVNRRQSLTAPIIS